MSFAEDIILEEELVRLLPQIYQANAIAEELKKRVNFEIVLISPQARGLKNGTTEVSVIESPYLALLMYRFVDRCSSKCTT